VYCHGALIAAAFWWPSHRDLVPKELVDLGVLRDGGELLVLQAIVICPDDERARPKIQHMALARSMSPCS
jgi:hypothetical protein